MVDLTKLKEAVERDNTVNQSAITLMEGLFQQIKDAKGDQAKIDEIIATFEAQQQDLADAVVANTPASGN